ncbi:MAG: helix-turn-helix domain-containing protein [Eubacteriales bacterium]|nr:helix-turn-helix domain-containing protein [Eubacteriales bacterium]
MDIQNKAPYEKVNIAPFSYAVSLIGGKWKMDILFWLWKCEVMRYSEIKKALGNVTHKMLSDRLKELERDELVIRREYPQVPPKVEYYLSEKGLSLMPILQAICKWGHENSEDGTDKCQDVMTL